MKRRLLFAAIETPEAGSTPARLTAEGYRVDVAADERALLLLAGLHAYEAIVIDAATPALDAVAAVRQLRRNRVTVPILMLSAHDDVADRVTGLDAGADDYLCMPFSMPELLARLRALLRRPRIPADAVLRVADLELNRVTHQVRRAGERVELTPREFALLELLMSASPGPVSRATIMERLWHRGRAPRSNVVNVLINAVRCKTHRDDRPALLHTVRGVGYCCRTLL